MGIKATQKRIGVDKWHRLLGELLSMTIALPGTRGLFSHTQESLRHMQGKMSALTRGVQQALAEFCWLAEDLIKRPTSLYDLMPLQPIVGGYHDSSGYICVEAVLPGPTAVPWTPNHSLAL